MWLCSSLRPDPAGPPGPALGGSLVARLPAGFLSHLSDGTPLLLLPQEHAQRGESVSPASLRLNEGGRRNQVEVDLMGGVSVRS